MEELQHVEQRDSPFVCNLAALNADQRRRYQAVVTRLQRLVQDIAELPNGYAFRHTSDTATIALVAEFITLERLCCPFLDFALEVEREGGPVWLRLAGSEGVKDFLRAELGFQAGASATRRGVTKGRAPTRRQPSRRQPDAAA